MNVGPNGSKHERGRGGPKANHHSSFKDECDRVTNGSYLHAVTHLFLTCTITSSHLTSPHLTSPHLTSPHLTSPHLTSPLLPIFNSIFKIMIRNSIASGQRGGRSITCCIMREILSRHVSVLMYHKIRKKNKEQKRKRKRKEKKRKERKGKRKNKKKDIH